MRMKKAVKCASGMLIFAETALLPDLTPWGWQGRSLVESQWVNDGVYNTTAMVDSLASGKAKQIDLDPRDAIFLHIGKAGGGNARERLKQWNLNISVCHPKPCVYRATENPDSGIIVPIRDPVDRYLSAFYWRLIVLCNPDGDERFGRGGGHAASRPERFCTNGNEDEKEGIFHVFRRDASLLAEGLCSSDATTRTLARRTLRSLQHAGKPIAQWLKFDWEQRNIFALVMEKGIARLDIQVDAAVEWLYERLSFESSTSFADRASFSKQQQITGKEQHTSKAIKRQLSPAGEKCVAQYYRRDYELLGEHKERLCKTRDCLEGIQSILDRRSFLFEHTSNLAEQ